MKVPFLEHRFFVPDGRAYLVKVADHPEFNLAFPTRDTARVYKWALKVSKRRLYASIHLAEFSDGFQTEDREVS